MKQDILIISLRISQSEEVHSLFAQNAVTSELVNDIPMASRQLAAHTPAFLWIDLEMETARLVLDEIANAFIHPPPYIILTSCIFWQTILELRLLENKYIPMCGKFKKILPHPL